LTDALQGSISIRSLEGQFTAVTFTVKTYKNHETNEFLEPVNNFETINLSEGSEDLG